MVQMIYNTGPVNIITKEEETRATKMTTIMALMKINPSITDKIL